MDSGLAAWRELRRIAGQHRRRPSAMSGAKQQALVAGQIAKLPERTRLILALRYYEGLGVDELATALDLPRQEVSREIAAAVTGIHRALKAAEEDHRAEETG